MDNSGVIDLTGCDASTGPLSSNKEQQPTAAGDGHSNASPQPKRRFPEPVFTAAIFFNSALRMRKKVTRQLKPLR